MNVAGNLSKDQPRWARINPAGRWTRRAACLGHDPNLWFLDDHAGNYDQARRICAGCTVRQACLDWALETKTEHGVFGGLNPRERRKLRRQPHLADSDHQRIADIRPRSRYL